jgi:hypothetical protein
MVVTALRARVKQVRQIKPVAMAANPAHKIHDTSPEKSAIPGKIFPAPLNLVILSI